MVTLALLLALETLPMPADVLADGMYAPAQKRSQDGTCPAFSEGSWRSIQDGYVYRGDGRPGHIPVSVTPTNQPTFDFGLGVVVPGLRTSRRWCSFEADAETGSDQNPVHINTRVVMLHPGAARMVTVRFEGDVVTTSYVLFTKNSD